MKIKEYINIIEAGDVIIYKNGTRLVYDFDKDYRLRWCRKKKRAECFTINTLWADFDNKKMDFVRGICGAGDITEKDEDVEIVILKKMNNKKI